MFDIITDSACDLTDQQVRQLRLTVVPFYVSTDGEQSRSVNFDISIRISNTLNDLSVTFDLAAPDDLSMQNALRSLTPEQRAMQAMNLFMPRLTECSEVLSVMALRYGRG